MKDGRVPFIGYVMRTTMAGNNGPEEDPNALTFRLYLSPKFDRWLEIDKDDLLRQEPLTDKKPQRSMVWIRGNAVITQSQYATAMYASQTIDSGDDDPTAYPRGGGG
jgi:hypothetical protein